MVAKRVVRFLLVLSFVLPMVFVLPVNALPSATTPRTSITESQRVIVRVYYKDPAEIDQLISFDLLEYNNLSESYVLVLASEAEIAAIRNLGFKVLIDEKQTSSLKAVEISRENGVNTIPGYSCYRTVEETYATAQSIANAHPNLAEWIDVGDSWQKAIGPLAGYDMMVLKLTNHEIGGEKPVFFITASIHAREYAPAEIATRFAEYLVNNYGTNADVTWLLDYTEIHVMFHANPDGRKIAETGSSWRKNRDNDDGCSTTYGVDLNRNFSYQWATGGSSGSPCDETYRGPSAASEPETQAITNYIASVFPDQRNGGAAPADAAGIYIDLHSSGGYVMWPWGYTTSTPPNNTQLQTFGRKLAFFNNYTAGQITRVLYVASGGSVDYSYGEMGVASYAIEVGTAFFQPCTSFESTVYPVNFNALIYAAKVSRTPYMTPLGPDSLNLSLNDGSVPAGSIVSLTGLADDTRYKSGSGEATQNIAAAEYYINTPPWVSGAVPQPLNATDGAFNSKTENLTGNINTSGWAPGRYTLYVRSKDTSGNWGAISAVFLTIEESQLNRAPVIDQGDAVEVAMSEDGQPIPFQISISATDPEGDPLTWSLSGGPTHGTASVSGNGSSPIVSYSPALNFNGADVFIVSVSDGQLSDQISISAKVAPVNDAPMFIEGDSVLVEMSEDGSPVAFALILSAMDADNDTLSWSVTAAPGYGTASVAGDGSQASVTYLPEANYYGTDQFSVSVSDGELSDVILVNVNVEAVNDPPLITGQMTLTTEEDAALLIQMSDILVSDVDQTYPEGFTLTLQPGSSYTIDGNQVLPVQDFHGNLDVPAVVNDGEANSNIFNLSVTVTPINDAPIAQSQTLGSTMDTPLQITLTGEDPDGDVLVYTIATNPSFGELSGEIPSLVYTPQAGFSGEDSFTFTVSDGSVTSVEATVSIKVSPVNHAPVASDLDLDTNEDTDLHLTLIGYDSDEDSLVYIISTMPSHGELIVEGPDLVYTPYENYYGEDNFSYQVSDGELNSNVAFVRLTVMPVNDQPVAQGQTVETAEDQTSFILLSAIDVDADSLTYIITSNPEHGLLNGSAPNLTYVPKNDFYGADSFRFLVSDGQSESAEALVEITVAAVNDAPIAISQTVQVNENESKPIVLSGVDVDPDTTLSFTMTTQPSNGKLIGSGPNWVYTPNPYFYGVDSFTFTVSDGLLNSNLALVTINVLEVNYLPVVQNMSLSTLVDQPLSIILNAVDLDGDLLTFEILSQPTYGTLEADGSMWVYTPATGFTGQDRFTYRAWDGTGYSDGATVEITVIPAGPIEVFWDNFETDRGWIRNAYGTDSATLGVFERANPENLVYYGNKQLGTTVSGQFDLVTGPLAGSNSGAYDLDGGSTSMRSPSILLPENKELTLSFSYYLAHYTNASSADYLRVTILGQSSQQIFEETGAGDNDDAVWDTFSADISAFAGQTVYILISAGDMNSASFVEAAIDDVLIMAAPINQPPVALGQTLTTTEDQSISITLQGFDPEGAELTYRVTVNPLHGALTGLNGAYTYLPTLDFAGQDQFSFVSNDGKSDSLPAVISITINPVNDKPTANPLNLSTQIDVPLAITLTGSDPEGSVLTFEVTAQPQHGVLSMAGAGLVYTPGSAYTGTDSFQFTASDGELESQPAEVTISILPAGPVTIFYDDFETNLGWIPNPSGTDTAKLGLWERANPADVNYSGPKQLGTTVSGSNDLVTGPLAGSAASAYDLDGGLSTIRSPQIVLPVGRTVTLSFSYYFAHNNTSSSSDFLRVSVVGSTSSVVLQETGARNDDDASWITARVNLSAFAGQTITILIEAADGSNDSLVEAAVDNVLITAE